MLLKMDVNIVRPKEITAHIPFTYGDTTKYTVTLAASPEAGGTVTGGGTVDAGESLTIKATAAEGYTFVKWSDNDTNAERTYTPSANVTLTATFEEGQ